MTTKLKLNWNTLHKMTREEILSGACINTKFANYEWCEIETWLQLLIIECLEERSRQTCTIAVEDRSN